MVEQLWVLCRRKFHTAFRHGTADLTFAGIKGYSPHRKLHALVNDPRILYRELSLLIKPGPVFPLSAATLQLHASISSVNMPAVPHPLSDLSVEETTIARDVVLKLHPGAVVDFRAIYLLEPNKEDVLRFLELEHAGKVTTAITRPERLAQVKYDVIGGSEPTQYHESFINLVTSQRVKHTVVGQEHHASLSM